MEVDKGTDTGRLCGYCQYRVITSTCCIKGYLQAISSPCMPTAPFAIVKGKVISYNEFIQKGGVHDNIRPRVVVGERDDRLRGASILQEHRTYTKQD